MRQGRRHPEGNTPGGRPLTGAIHHHGTFAMDIRKLGLGLGAFAAGAAAWVWGASRFGDRLGAGSAAAGQGARGTAPAPRASAGSSPDAGVGAVPGDSTTSPVVPRPATLAAAPVGMAETDKGLPQGTPPAADGHVPTDLLADAPVGRDSRAPDAFRPDPTAVPTAEEREALRPATGPAPTLVADRGSGLSEAAGAA